MGCCISFSISLSCGNRAIVTSVITYLMFYLLTLLYTLLVQYYMMWQLLNFTIAKLCELLVSKIAQSIQYYYDFSNRSFKSRQISNNINSLRQARGSSKILTSLDLAVTVQQYQLCPKKHSSPTIVPLSALLISKFIVLIFSFPLSLALLLISQIPRIKLSYLPL